MSGMLERPIINGGRLNMDKIHDIVLDFSAQVLVHGTMDFDELLEYNGDVEDYVENNMQDCDVEIQDIQESLNIFTQEEYTNLVRNHDNAFSILNEELAIQKAHVTTLSETVISLNEQIKVLRGN